MAELIDLSQRPQGKRVVVNRRHGITIRTVDTQAGQMVMVRMDDGSLAIEPPGKVHPEGPEGPDFSNMRKGDHAKGRSHMFKVEQGVTRRDE